MPRRRRRRSPFSLIALAWRLGPLIFLLSLILGGLWYVNELRLSQDAVYAGLPRQDNWSNPSNWVHVIRNPGFVVGYSEIRRNPLWVAYRAKPVEKKRFMPRPDYFLTDYRSLVRVSQADYSRSGYDRGHLAPNYLISQIYGREAQLATFRMTNIVPQRPRLNRELWQRIEEVEADFFARWFRELWVITGPVFDDKRQFLASGVEVPDGFYKIMLDIDRAGNPRVIAFLVPQQVRGDAPLDQLVVTVDQLESITGFDFFPDMASGIEAKLEASKPDHHWKLAQVGRMPSRYKVK
ncbi:MAG: DNA/RNA non-specific endonuclease [Salinisphaeraceae bacterium]|nr:DNA/RNA non-specific endonuclease [Salinisphaeraceae bacterium]